MLMTLKNILSYMITIVVITVVSSILLYYLNKLYPAPYDTFYLKTSFAFSFAFLFITYNIFLLAHPTLKSRNYSLFTCGIFCFLLETALLAIPFALVAGIDSRAILFNLGSVGLCSFAIPYVNKFLNDKLIASPA